MFFFHKYNWLKNKKRTKEQSFAVNLSVLLDKKITTTTTKNEEDERTIEKEEKEKKMWNRFSKCRKKGLNLDVFIPSSVAVFLGKLFLF